MKSCSGRLRGGLERPHFCERLDPGRLQRDDANPVYPIHLSSLWSRHPRTFASGSTPAVSSLNSISPSAATAFRWTCGARRNFFTRAFQGQRQRCQRDAVQAKTTGLIISFLSRPAAGAGGGAVHNCELTVHRALGEIEFNEGEVNHFAAFPCAASEPTCRSLLQQNDASLRGWQGGGGGGSVHSCEPS